MFTHERTAMKLGYDDFKMAVCFGFGSFVASTPALYGAPDVWISLWGYGVVFALPAFLAVLLLYRVFRNNVHARPNAWCVAALFFLTAGTMGAIYAVAKDLHGFDLFFAGCVFAGSVAATVLFRIWVLPMVIFGNTAKKLIYDSFKMAVCFGFGSFVASLSALYGAPEIWIFIWGYGALFALPTFLVVLLVYGVFRNNVQAHPNIWCVAAPFFLTAGIMGAIYAAFRDLYESDLFIAVSVFVGSVAATALFRIWVPSRMTSIGQVA